MVPRPEKVEEILSSLEDDSDLAPQEIREWWKSCLTNQHSRYLDILSLLQNCDGAVSILEVGSVPGQLTVLLERLGYDIRGVDIDPRRLRMLWEKYGITVDKVDVERENLPFPNQSFDIVLFTEILEHLRVDPLHALREVYRVLKTSGLLILSTPNITPRDRVAFLLGRSYQGNPVEEFGKLELLGHMGHIRLYSVEEVREFLEHVGFRVVSIVFKGQYRKDWKTNLLLLFWHNISLFRPHLYITATPQTPLS